MRAISGIVYGLLSMLALAGTCHAQTISSVLICDESDNDPCDVVPVDDQFLQDTNEHLFPVSSGQIAGIGYRHDLYRLAEIRDESGRVLAKSKGADLMVLSRTAYAKFGKKDGAPIQLFSTKKGAKPVKAPFASILSIGGTSFGLVSRSDGNKKERPDSLRVNGTIMAIGSDGQPGATYKDVLDAVDYGDFTLLVYRNNGGVQIFDKALEPLSPVLTDAWLFQSNYADGEGYGYDAYESRRAVYGIKVFDAGDRKKTLFRLIPKRKDAALPEDLIGVTPISYAGWGESDCLDPEQLQCVMRVRSFIAVWAGANGEPEVSLLDGHAEHWEPIHYKSFDWYEGLNFKGLIAEQFDGDFRIITPVTKGDGSVDYVYVAETYHNALDAQIGAKQQEYLKLAEINAKAQAEYEFQKYRYEAQQRQLAEQAAAEEKRAQEMAEVEAIIRSGDNAAICSISLSDKYYYAREMLVSACVQTGGMFKDVPVERQDFWSSMMAGLRATNKALADYNSQIYSGGFTGTYSGGYSATPDNGDFDRSMGSIDNTLNAISDPNWNGAAAASW